MEKVGIFLTGGGGKGSFQVGFFKAIEELDIKYDVICGSSIGALVGAAATYLDSYSMFECWKTLTLESVLKVDSNKINLLEGKKKTLALWKETFLSCITDGLFINIDDIRRLMHSSLNGKKVKDSPIDFGVTTTVLPSFEMLKVYKDVMTEENILEYVLASLYLPIFSKEKIIDNRNYLDIATIRRYPFEMLKERNCSKIYIVDVGDCPFSKTINTAKKIFDKNIDVNIIRMDNQPSLLDFSEAQAIKNYHNGYDKTMKVLTKTIK